MIKKSIKHKAWHERHHKYLLALVQDWEATSRVEELQRSPQRRTVQSLIEWSKSQCKAPEEPTNFKTFVYKKISFNK